MQIKLKPNSTSIGLLILALTQFPFAINETLKLSCIVTTWSDYGVFWNWKDIPLDSRIRYCNGGLMSPRER